MSLPFWLASQLRKPFTLRQVQRRCLNYSPPPKPESGPREIVIRNFFKNFGLDKIPLWDWNIGWMTKPWPSRGSPAHGTANYYMRRIFWTSLVISRNFLAFLYLRAFYRYVQSDSPSFLTREKIETKEKVFKEKSDELYELAKKRQETANLEFKLPELPVWPPPWKQQNLEENTTIIKSN